MIRVGLTGVPGAGKTSTARYLAGCCRAHKDLKNVELVHEYARRYISKYGMSGLDDQILVMNKQKEWEDRVGEVDLLITDSPIFLGFAYALEMYEHMATQPTCSAEKNAMQLSHIFKTMLKMNTPPRYDLILHLPPIIQPVEDGVRASYQFKQDWRNAMNARMESVLNIFKPKLMVTLKSITIEDRVEESISIIQTITTKSQARSK